MEQTVLALNQMVADGVLQKYAIGGAMAVLFHAEPVLTHDLDVFVFFPESAGQLISLEPIYRCARARGYSIEKEHVIVEGVPVQFLPVHDALTEEALREAVMLPYGDASAPVVGLEHLLAIMVKAGRAKDWARVAHVLETADVDLEKLDDILKRHALDQKWARWKEQVSGE